MTLNIFKQAAKIWRTLTGLAGRDARVGDRIATAGSRAAVWRFHGASAAATAACLVLSTGASFSATYNTIPALFNLVNLSMGLVCVSGPPGAGLYLTPSGPSGQLGWTTTPPAQVFYPVGYNYSSGQYSSVQSTMGSYINPIANAQLNFYLVSGGGSTCPATMPSSTPVGLFEFTGVSVPNIPTPGDTTYQSTLDTSNVNNFQVPLMFEVMSSTASPAFIDAQLGNAVYSPHAAISTVVTGNAFPIGSIWLAELGCSRPLECWRRPPLLAARR
jgi:hypothetical protein